MSKQSRPRRPGSPQSRPRAQPRPHPPHSAGAQVVSEIEEEPEPAETVQQAISELGQADWVDEETGLPAEAPVTPHLHER